MMIEHTVGEHRFIHRDDPNIHCELCGAAKLSRMLYLARESLEMWADVVEHVAAENSGVRFDGHTRRLIKEIDDYRAERGWPANGWGGE